MIAVNRDETILMPEGEKDVNNAWEMGFVATCNSEGTGKWRDELSEHLQGHPVAIFTDNDTPVMRATFR